MLRPETEVFKKTTAAGAAFLAGLGVGVWHSKKELQRIWRRDCEFKPSLASADRAARLKAWHAAVARSRG